jgi:hypothetical protein
MQASYYDRDANPVSEQQWQQLSRQPGYTYVAYADSIQHRHQITALTLWSGIATADSPDGPLIFRTSAGILIPRTRRTVYERQWGWPTLDAARAGHYAVTAWLTDLAAFLAGHTGQLPPPSPAARPTLHRSPGTADPAKLPGSRFRGPRSKPSGGL